MAVDLNGFENTPREERQVLNEEQFNRYISSVEMPYDERVRAYIMTKIIKSGQINLEKLYEENNISTKEELAELLKEEFGFDILTEEPRKFLKDIPEVAIRQLGDLDSKIDSVHEWEELESLVDEIDFSGINELYEKRLKDIATEVSKHDLSQIPPEAYANARFLRYINFQNTGAKLDFEYIHENRASYSEIFISSENLKGTEIISFNRSVYRKNKEDIEEDVFGWTNDIIELNPENFDISQYQVIIDSFNVANEYVDSNLGLFLVNQEIQDNSKWLIDYGFADLEKRKYFISKMWTQLTRESQLKNRENFKKLIDYYLKNKDYIYEVSNIVICTDPSLLDEHADKLKEIYTNDKSGEIENIFFYNVFPNFSDDYKEHFYEENENLSSETRALVLSKTNPQYIKENFIELFDKFIKEYKDESQYLGPFYYVDKIMKSFDKYEFDEATLDYILETVKKEIPNSKSNYTYLVDNVFANLAPKNQKDYYKTFMEIGLDNNVDKEKIAQVFEKLNSEFKEENFDDILAFSQTLSPEVAHYIRGTGYINMLQRMNPEKKETFIEENSADILLSLRTKYEKEDIVYVDSLSPEERKRIDTNYSKDFTTILLEMDKKGDLDANNVNVIIDNLPKLGKEVISRLYSSNSEMIRANASQLITAVSTLEREQAIALIEDTERLFSKDTIPDFVKIYKFYENVIEMKQGVLKRALNKGSNYPPELQQAGSEKAGMRIIFSDLLNISLKSNNKSLKKFINLLENGNEIYVKFLKGGKDLDSLTPEEKDTLRKYTDTLYTIYDESLVAKHDKKRTGTKIINSKDYIKTLEDLTQRYIGNAFPKNLSNEVLNTILGRMDELLAGRKTLEDFKSYMEDFNKKSNERHAELEKTKLVLEPGDLIKGVRDATSFLQSLFSNGIRAGEFLGTDTHTDATPLDSDHSLILPRTVKDTLSATISSTTSGGGYGNFFLVIKKDPEKIKFTRDDPEYTFKSEKAPEYQSKLGKNADRVAIKARINNRINETFEEPKLEAFSSRGENNDHYGVRTGMAITDVDYIVVSSYDKRIGYELAMNGTFIPVVDRETNEVVFGIDDYNKIREQMQGMPYYETKAFEVDQTAYISRVEEKVTQLFPDGDVKESISEKDARSKREAIERKVRVAISEKLGLGFESKITGDIAPGFIEFIDTGSTGRGTNLPGDGDFDFSVKIDKSMFDNPKKLEEFKATLREVLAIRSNHEDCKTDEFNGNFRYKKVQIDGVEMPLDIDITFMQKTEDISYSTDMAVKERLQGLKENDPEGYKRVIANIVLAKEMLKKEGIYKKESSDGATKEGGFGGVGVENWILQNGGSFVKAMQTFLEASEKAKDFNEFMEIYPIFDFGQNHMAKSYSHDSFIRGLSQSGYKKMQEKFKEFIKELQQEQLKEISMVDLSKNAIKQGIRTGEVTEASKSMIPEEQQLDTNQTLEGED